MITASYSDHFQHGVENILTETPMSLPIIHKHLLHDLLCCHAAKATRLGPGLIDDAVAGHTIGWERPVYKLNKRELSTGAKDRTIET